MVLRTPLGPPRKNKGLRETVAPFDFYWFFIKRTYHTRAISLGASHIRDIYHEVGGRHNFCRRNSSLHPPSLNPFSAQVVRRYRLPDKLPRGMVADHYCSGVPAEIPIRRAMGAIVFHSGPRKEEGAVQKSRHAPGAFAGSRLETRVDTSGAG